MLRLLGRPTR
ncbi:hypothetical protein LINPERHAP1_LOCUS24836 [Linum perenne]